MSIAQQLVTADELLHMPDDGFRYELVQGELRRMAPAGEEHGSLTMNIAGPLHQYVRAHNLGKVYAAETGFRLTFDPDTVRAPDASFVTRERVEAAGHVKGYWPGAPDLAIEVISPGDLYTEVDEKVMDWLNAGTRMVIVVNPRKRSVTVYRSSSNINILTEDDTLDGGDVVPGWTIPVHDIFV
jgi:Uma2 family endonuclease